MIAVIAALVLAAINNRPNPGGNTAALVACNNYIMAIQSWAADHPGSSFQLSQADPQTRAFLARLPANPLIGSARLLAIADGVHLNPAGDKRIIMVCDRAYDNVPQRIFGKSPLAHAVAYSTGETGLINPQEFGRLDLSVFLDLQTLN